MKPRNIIFVIGLAQGALLLSTSAEASRRPGEHKVSPRPWFSRLPKAARTSGPKHKDATETRMSRAAKPAKRLSATNGKLPLLTRDASYEGAHLTTIFETGVPSQRTVLLWFHGAGQAPDNELIRRMTNSLQFVGASLEIHAVPYGYGAEGDFNTDYPEAAAALVGKGKVFIGGHSAGGRKAYELADKYPEKFAGLITLNGAGVGTTTAPAIPSLIAIGENDGGARFLTRRATRKLGSQKIVAVKTPHANLTHLVASQGDHSMRFRVEGDGDKDAASRSPDTEAMNTALAKAIAGFMDANAPSLAP